MEKLNSFVKDKAIETKISFDEFERLFQEGHYAEALSCSELKKYIPCDLPKLCVEKLLTAANRLLFPDRKETVSLNLFQEELFYSCKTIDFVRKWKNNGKIDENIIEQCSETAIAHFNYPDDKKYVIKLIDALGHKNAKNDNYVGITERFKACENNLISQFYVVRVFLQNKEKNIYNSLSEYCQMVKDFRKSESRVKMTDELCMCNFKEVLYVTKNYLMKDKEFPENILRNILSVYFEYGNLDEAKDILSFLDPEHKLLEWRLISLLFNYNEVEEYYFVSLIKKGINRQLLQRCISLIWDNFQYEKDLSEKFLKILSWIIVYDDYTSIEEILKCRSLNDLGYIRKQNMLVNSFSKICDYAENDNKMYALASFIVNMMQPDMSLDIFSTDVKEKMNSWYAFSEAFYNREFNKLDNLTRETENEFLLMFSIFHLDTRHYICLQEKYSDWFFRMYRDDISKVDNVNDVLDNLYRKKAYDAYVRVYSGNKVFYSKKCKIKYIEKYVGSLVSLQRYADAISFLCNVESEICEDKKNILISKILGENFRKNGLNDLAFSCFGESFSSNDAINILQKVGKVDPKLPVNSLIALYIHRKEYIKAAYLYAVFANKVRRGYAKLYRSVHNTLTEFFKANELESNYHVIDCAFQVMDAESLVAFLDWTKLIVIPNFKERRKLHVFAYYYNKIVSEVNNKSNWEYFLRHLYANGIDKNAWKICVCERVLKSMFKADNTPYSELAFTHLFDREDLLCLPPAFLVYLFQYIENGDSRILCQKTIDILNSNDVHCHLIEDNNWFKFYSGEVDKFKEYCLKTFKITGNDIYRNLVVKLNICKNIKEIMILTEGSADKKILIGTICRNYLECIDLRETAAAIKSINLTTLSDIEKEIFKLLNIVFEEDIHLLCAEPNLFSTEEEVRRFKKDCAKILKYYPQKTGLFSFHKNCTNESYKILVYSYIFNIFYDQDFYSKLEKEYSDFSNEHDLCVYLRMQKTAYKVQSIVNVTFPAFYKKWRYAKLYLSNFILNEILNERRDYEDEIVALMKKNDHYNVFYASFYIPFTERVKEFWGFSGLSEKIKKHFLFALMVGVPGNFFLEHGGQFAGLPDNVKRVCRQLVESLDYRSFNAGLYESFRSDLIRNEYSLCLDIAKGISQYAFDAIQGLSEKRNDHRAWALFAEFAFLGKPSQVLNKAITIDIGILRTYGSVVIPLLCSLQFVFHINDRFRALTIGMQRREILCERYGYIANYLSSTEENTTKAIAAYMWALHSCMCNDREKAKDYISEYDIVMFVPEQWKEEAKQIINFANGDIEEFKPSKSIVDGSLENQDKEIDISFAYEILSNVFDNDNILVSDDEAITLYENYLESVGMEKVKIGLELLIWRSKNSEKQNLKIPPVNDFALDVGLNAMSLAEEFPKEEKFLIASILLKSYSNYFSHEDLSKYDKLKSIFGLLIQSDLSISIWTKYYEIIEVYLRESRKLPDDFADLKEKILKECVELELPTIAYDEKDSRYEKLLKSFSGLTSDCCKKVRKAIEDKKKNLGDGIRLSVKFENEEITDGHIYFQIRNTGKRMVSFVDDKIHVSIKQENQLEDEVEIKDIGELQCGSMTGGRKEVVLPSEDRNISVKICVFRELKDGTKELVCDAEKNFKTVDSEKLNVSVDAKYDVQSAVSDENLLFGRETVKESLRRSIPETGVTLIYGPSRIGKTSLMNWIRNKFACDQGNVITITCGGENGRGKKTDYVRNINDREQKIPFDNDQGMSKYILVDTMAYGLNENNGRLGKPTKKVLSYDFVNEVLGILKKDATDVKIKYFEISRLLEDEDLELWLMLDEFQQIVEKWEPDSSSSFIEVLDLLQSTEKNMPKPNRIKLIVCGSDELLRHIILKHNSVWKKAFRTTIPVEPLKDSDFHRMIEEDPAVVGTNLKYSPLALETLSAYTGGVALYGKEICNTILEEIRNNSQKYCSRTWIYTIDVSEATQKLLRKQSSELTTSGQEGIREIYDAVTHHLDVDTDMQMLWYMAKWMYENKKYEGFPEKVFTQARLTKKFSEHYRDSLEIAQARKILRKEVSQENNEVIYNFTTIFYYYAFCGSAEDDILIKNLIFESAKDKNDVIEWKVSEIVSNYRSLPPNKRNDTFGDIWRAEDDEDVRKKIKRDFFPPTTEYHTSGDIVNGDKITNVQNITNTLNAIFAHNMDNKAIVGKLNELPRLFSYCDDKKIPSLEELNSNETDVADLAEKKLEASTTKMVSQYLGALISQDNYQDFFCVWEQLGIEADQYKDLTEKLNSSLLVELILAAKLDYIFSLADNIEDEQSSIKDYSPVSIMYCKILEKTLKHYHTGVYTKRFWWASTKVIKENDKIEKVEFVKFGDLRGMYKDDIDRVQNKIMLGAFLYPIDVSKERGKRNLKEICRNNSELEEKWSKHSEALIRLKEIRNTSAHGMADKVVDRGMLIELKKWLFQEKELERIIDLK